MCARPARAASVVACVGFLTALSGCGESSDNGKPDGAARDGAVADASAPDASTEPKDGGGSGDCADVPENTIPDELACTGLYSDLGEKTLAEGVRMFDPAYVLWSDGAVKMRFVQLPPGGKIDASDPLEWGLPVGTKLWKEFKWNGQRVETRLYWKVGDNRWLKTAYHWTEDESSAQRFAGGDVKVGDDTYYIPSAKECDQCHKGRTDRALGFEAALLGLPGAKGTTLKDLIDEGVLTGNTLPATLSLGDDGTGKATAALGWMHVNCGVSCHNGNIASEAYKTDLRMRLDPTELDGRAVNGFDAIATSVGVQGATPRWSDEVIIDPGSADTSLLFRLINSRDDQMRDQMPPIASRVVDPVGVPLMRDWIDAIGGNGDDAGVP